MGPSTIRLRVCATLWCALLSAATACERQPVAAVAAAPAAAQQPQPDAQAPARAHAERWQIMRMDGRDAGYAREATRSVEVNGAPGVETTVETLLRLRRMGTTVDIQTTVVHVQDAAGQIARYRQVMNLSQVETVYEGVVNDDVLELVVTTRDTPRRSEIPWESDVPGPLEVERRVAAAHAGDRISYFHFDPSLGAPVETTVTIGAEEAVDVDGREERLIRTTMEIAGLPATTSWVDRHGRSRKSSTALMGLSMESVAVERARVLDWIAGDGVPAEVFLQSTITANVRLARPRSLESITYRVATKDRTPLPDLASARQHIVARPAAHEQHLRIDVVVPPESRRQTVAFTASASDDEFLAANPMVQSDDAELIAFARDAVAGETDAWRAAVRLERVVHARIDKKSMDVAFASAAETFETRRGDCSEHAVLLTALCRAAGVPARVAMGLVYVGGIFGGHAWTEVRIDDQWYALDATIGRGTVDPTHVTLGRTSLKDGAFSTGLLGVLAGLGNLELEILEYRRDGEAIRADDAARAPQVRDGMFEDRHEGVRCALPPGFAPHVPEPDILEMSNRHEMIVLRANDGAEGVIRLVSTQVPYDFALDDFQERAQRGARGPVTSVPTRIAAREGIVVSWQRGERTTMHAGTIAGETLYSLEGEALDAAGRAAFQQVLESLRIR